jgi:SAM-dependent methyltransferase
VTGPRVDANSLRAVYGAGAASYDALWHPVIRPPALALIRALDIGDATRVLDVGAGTGALTAALRDAAPRAEVTALDPSSAMLRVAHDRAGATVCLADAARLPVASGSVDAVLLAYVLFHLADPAAGVGEAARVLRPGGRAGTVTWASETQPEAGTVWEATLSEFGVPALAAHGNHAGLDREDDVAALHTATGLARPRVWRASIGHTFVPADYLRMRTAGGAGRARLALVDDTTRQAAIAELDRRLRALSTDAFTFSGEVICAASEKPGDGIKADKPVARGAG